MEKGQSIFLQVFGSSPKMKVLDFLLTHQAFDYSMTEMAQKTNVSYPVVVNIIEDFLRNKIVIETRKIGKARLFRINTESELARQLLRLQWNMAKIHAVLTPSMYETMPEGDNHPEIPA